MPKLEKVPAAELQREIERRWGIDAAKATLRRQQANTPWRPKPTRPTEGNVNSAAFNDGGPGAP